MPTSLSCCCITSESFCDEVAPDGIVMDSESVFPPFLRYWPSVFQPSSSRIFFAFSTSKVPFGSVFAS